MTEEDLRDLYEKGNLHIAPAVEGPTQLSKDYSIPSGFVKAETTPQFVKSDTGKNKLSLIDPFFIKELGEILTYGVDKYSSYGIIPEDLTIGRISQTWKPTTIQKILYAQLATSNLSGLKKLWSADAATTSDLNEMYQDTKNDNKNSLQNGKQLIETRCENMSALEIKILKENKSIKNVSGLEPLLTTGLLKSIMIVVLQKDVQYAVTSSNSLTSTIVTSPENFEEYFVVSATTDSECLEIIYKVLKKLSLISNPLSLVETSSAANNWQLCSDPTRYKDALLRHLYAYLSGELTDPESGLPHTSAIAFNTMALRWFDRNLNENATTTS